MNIESESESEYEPTREVRKIVDTYWTGCTSEVQFERNMKNMQLALIKLYFPRMGYIQKRMAMHNIRRLSWELQS